MNKNYKLKTNEAKNIQNLAYSVDEIFLQLKRKANKTITSDDEYIWKKLFNKKVIVYIDEFLNEIAEDVDLSYSSQSFVEDIREFINKD
jgi:hypothetical protein